METKIHEIRNGKRFREMLGIKQKALAWELGEDWNQKKIYLLLAQENIDTPLLQQISAVLKIHVGAIQNFDEEQVINIIASTINDNSSFFNQGTIHFIPIEAVLKMHGKRPCLKEC